MTQIVSPAPATRASVLHTLRRLGGARTSLEIAAALQAPPETVGRILGVLFFKNIIERGELPPGCKPKFVYRAYAVQA